MHCDFAFYVGGTHDNVADIAELERTARLRRDQGVHGLLHRQPAGAGRRRRQRHSVGNPRRAAFHAEDDYRLRARESVRVYGDPTTHPVWRDVRDGAARDRAAGERSRATGAAASTCSTSPRADEMVFLADHKDIASVEVTPHHLTLDETAYERLGTLAQMNPPVRDSHHRDGVCGRRCATALPISSAPTTRRIRARRRQQTYPDSPSGMTGVQTLVPIMLDHVNAGRLTLERFVDMTSAGPHRLFGIAGKGRIAAGYDADFTIVDLKRHETITNEWVASKAGWTPYDGVEVTGWPVGTIIRGKTVMWQGELVTPAAGEPIRFWDALPA